MNNAIIRQKAGKEFSTMLVKQITQQEVAAGELKVKMVSSRINPVDMDLMKGFPTLKYKNPQIGGIDGAGIVTGMGGNVAGFAIGDAVFFYRLFSDIGTWAQEITIPAAYCAKVPDNIGVADAGAIALPLLTAYDSLMQMEPVAGKRILIHGVGGGVGFQAFLIAKQLGLSVVGTGNKADKAVLEKEGIHRFIDYQIEDFSAVLKPKEVDYVFDTLGGEVLLKSLALRPEKVVSLKLADPKNMHKAGVKLPGLLNWIMALMMKKYTRYAKQLNVQLIGQITGANGPMLQQAATLIAPVYITRNVKRITLDEIAEKGLSKTDIGKLIVF